MGAGGHSSTEPWSDRSLGRASGAHGGKVALESPFGSCLSYRKQSFQFGERECGVHVIRFEQASLQGHTLLISKVSEAILPETPGNHVGAGGTFDDFLAMQTGVRLVINGGFNHYRKDFYDWRHQGYNVGDPVGLVKIREHRFEDFVHAEGYGFLAQREKGVPWRIVDAVERTEKYILGSTPLLVFEGLPRPLPQGPTTEPIPGKVTPPSQLWHAHQRHPRTAVGMTGDVVVFVLVEADIEGGGCTLLELREIGIALGLDSLLNLDGGGSSQFRLFGDVGSVVMNRVDPNDRDRVLGHILVIFDDALKNKAAERKLHDA